MTIYVVTEEEFDEDTQILKAFVNRNDAIDYCRGNDNYEWSKCELVGEAVKWV